MEMEARAVSNLSMTTIMASFKIKLNGLTEGHSVLTDIMGPLDLTLDYAVIETNKFTLVFEPVWIQFSITCSSSNPTDMKRCKLCG